MDPLAGAYEGIMSICDDPRKSGQRFFCSRRIDTEGDYLHQQDIINKNYYNFEEKSEKETLYIDSCASEIDSVQG